METFNDFITQRLGKWDELAKMAAQNNITKDECDIKITIKNNNSHMVVKSGIKLSEINNSLNLDDTLCCLFNDVLVDTSKIVDEDGVVEFINFDHPLGKKVFWHSSAHILGQALELCNHFNLSVGPALEEGGFYYEGSNRENNEAKNEENLTPKDLKILEKNMIKISKQKQPFEKLTITKEQALELFQYNPYKVEIISNKINDGDTCTVYKCGPFIDLCRGPHIPNTSFVKAFKLRSISSSYFLGDNTRDTLQRVYGISYPNKEGLKEYLVFLEEAERRDHRKIGIQQELFFFDKSSPGSCFFQPHGTRIYNKLVEFIRNEYWDRGFSEVNTPNLYKSELWKISGHWDKYQENMFIIQSKEEDDEDNEDNEDNENDKKEEHPQKEEQVFALKPMNCVGHCVMFAHTARSYKDLPIRYADFGVLHRNELEGSLKGLTRVRKFSQDDAHIFCMESQIESEINSALEFLEKVYGIFGFEFSLELSTRPDNYLGSIEIWDKAEDQLKNSLNNFGKPWTLNEKDGAFYGPKIDIHIKDALKRSYQCATIQLDFNLPSQERFDLKYVDQYDNHQKPVIIHRAIYGSLERFIAIITEHYAGKWPLWLSPRQIIILPISENFVKYANEIKNILHKKKYYVDINDSDKTINKKVLEAEKAHYNYILIVGAKEEQNRTVNIRYDKIKQVEKPLNDLLYELKNKKNNYL